MKAFLFFLFGTFLISISHAQIIAGPMLGPVELRDAKVWIEVAPQVKKVQLQYYKKGEPAKIKSVITNAELGNDFNPVEFVIGGLDYNTTYEYRFVVDGKPAVQKGEFTTKDLWQWRKPAPDFSFLTGSCAYFNEPGFDRPGKPYGEDSTIFETMAKEKSAFLLWLGDNWYTREVDYSSEWGLWYRAHKDRKFAVMQGILKAMPHLAIWDDHDYGPNDANGSYILKEASRKVFQKYWANPSYGENGQGIYTQYSYSDVDFFMLDDRWWRSSEALADSINGVPNTDKTMLGRQQMTWLKNALMYSRATFKIIAVGSQVLNPASPYDKLRDYKAEYNELMSFLDRYKIRGVLFLTGDRHHTEIIKVDRPGSYPLYDITVSPFTSGQYPFSGPEKDNPYRVLGVDQKQNYGKFTISGPKGQRKLGVEILGKKGEKLGAWSVMEGELR
jgi:alkaline phosphatase D